MKCTLPILILSFLYVAGFAQPVLQFTPISLSGPALVQPVDITGCGDGSGRLFIVEKGGYIRIVQNNAVLNNYFLDIHTQVHNSGERGMLGLAFHPFYPDSPYIYVNYVITGTITNRISRFTLNPNDPNDMDEASELILLTQTGVQTNHKAGDLVFGPDGYLYIGMGDGGGANDPSNAAQNLETLLGKMLRIDINNPAPPLNYGIPPDNPFVGIAGRDEIWYFGLRNPWRISFDRETGDFWIADVGQNLWEEINMIPAGTSGGLNLGWDCYESNLPAETQNCPGNPVFTWPVFEYPHNCDPCPVGLGASVTGGFVYRGDEYPFLDGYYICADYVSNYFWMIIQTGSNPLTFDVHVQNGTGIISGLVTFGEDDDGEFFASNLAGTLYAVNASDPLPVQWENILVSLTPKGNKIQWSIHQSFGIDQFIVQRSFQQNFDSYINVAFIPPIQDQIIYNFNDPYHQSIIVYYRIAAQMDDGSVEYSPVARVLPDPVSKPTLTFESITNMWRIHLPDPWRNGEILLYDLQGKEIFSRKIMSDTHINLNPPIIPGAYFVKISGEMGTWSDQLVW